MPKISALDKINADNISLINDISPSLKKSFNLAAYVNSSETLQQLVKLNVDLSKIEKNNRLASFIVTCDFKNDIEPRLLFLLNNNVDMSEVGKVFTNNPYLLTIYLEDLQTTVDYFKFRKFNQQDIATIFLKGPKVFNLKITDIDMRLAELGREYKLSAENIRNVIRKNPKLILIDRFYLKKCTFMFQEEMGFQKDEIKSLILNYSGLWVKFSKSTGHKEMLRTFDYVHNTMMLSHEQILKFPQILLTRVQLIRPRHLYLKILNRAQYDPTKPLYVPLKAFYDIDDAEFCLNYTKTSVVDYNEFLKTI